MMVKFFLFPLLILLAIINAPIRAQSAPDADTCTSCPRITYLNELSAGCITDGSVTEALQYAQNALQLSRQQKYIPGEAASLLQVGDALAAKGNYHRALNHLLHSLKLKQTLADKRNVVKLYRQTAIVFANLKQYPQALKCYYKYMMLSEESKLATSVKSIVIDSTVNANANQQDTADSEVIQPCYPLVVDADTGTAYEPDTSNREYQVAFLSNSPLFTADIGNTFNDGKPATGYGVLIHVNQPVPGQRKRYRHITEVGHTFVTLIKYNTDGSSVSQSVGFYPRKERFLYGTPLHPRSRAVFRNDASHDWNAMVGKIINRKRFDKIVQLVKNYGAKPYNLNNNNCTDFGIQAAGIAGIKLFNTSGKWPLGGGNNPGDTGESILENRVRNLDADSTSGLFIYSKPVRK